MSRFRVELGERSYPVRVTAEGPRALRELLGELAPSGLVLVSDRQVAPLQLPRWREALPADVAVALLEPGEASKALPALEGLWRAFLAAGLDRDGVVLALGGGVVGDVAGFAAATWLRGVRVVHLPTTLLAMADSAIGGKTGLNLEGKNLVGAFHQPAGVICDLPALATLPERQLRAGLGEVWKTGVLAGPGPFGRLEAEAAALRRGDPVALGPAVEACLRHKAAVVAADERESGARAGLNLGHTLGHALEAGGGGALLHGEAVALGLGFALCLAERLGLLEPPLRARIEALGLALGLAIRPAGPLTLEPLLPLLRRDKKARGGRPRWVLPTALGQWVWAEPEEAVLAEALAAWSG